MSKIMIALSSWIALTLTVTPPAAAEHSVPDSEGKMILGWLETIVLKPWDIVLRAKLDTGANTSSIDAEEITFFEKDQQKWVRFTVVKNKRNDKPDRRIEIERPVVRSVLIREHFWESQRRPVVTLPFCLNGTLFETEFNLVNRSKFKYPVLLGRRFLQKIALVDPDATSLTHTVLRDCNERGFTIEAKNADSTNPALPPASSDAVPGSETPIEKFGSGEAADPSSGMLAENGNSEAPGNQPESADDIDAFSGSAKKPTEIIKLVRLEERSVSRRRSNGPRPQADRDQTENAVQEVE